MKAFHLGRLIVLVLLALVLAAPLGACGKRGGLEPPDKESEYPRTYPSE